MARQTTYTPGPDIPDDQIVRDRQGRVIDRDTLIKGIGHYVGTAMPGQVGNFAVSGHRTTYGRPFHNIDLLRKGDVIVVETKTSYIVYAVERHVIVEIATLLTDDDLDTAGFARFDAIVAGVRAYNVRKAMRAAHPKLMAWVQNGGTYVVEYNRPTLPVLLVDPPGPYPFKVSEERVTVEEAPVKILDPANPIFTMPNKITQADFNGWVQERGVYFTTDWDPRYQTVLESHDPGEPDHPGGELYTRYGKGVFIYTGYAWFRQLPAGVPGAYRLFVNLVSAR